MSPGSPLASSLGRAIARFFCLVIVIASTYLAGRCVGIRAAALVAGLWALAFQLRLSRVILDLTRSVEFWSRLAHQDDLTGLPNTRSLHARLDEAVRERQALGLILLDVDRFKECNDTLGHRAGDEALKDLAAVLKSLVSDQRNVFRLGGDEFAALWSNLDERGSVELAERIRTTIATHAWSIRPITVSIGVTAGIPTKRGDLLDRADLALYEAKRQGRNRVVMISEGAGPEGPTPA